MNWEDECYLLSKSKFRENANIINVFSSSKGKVSGFIFVINLFDLPGIALDETPIIPRVRLAVDSSRPTISAISLNEVSPGDPLSIGDAGDLLVMLETLDDYGFNLDESAVLHYRVRAGEAEISRGSVPLPDTTPFGEQFFWTGYLDLTDAGATMLLPSYVVDVWVSGSDDAGNPFDTMDNSLLTPIASWPLALLCLL